MNNFLNSRFEVLVWSGCSFVYDLSFLLLLCMFPKIFTSGACSESLSFFRLLPWVDFVSDGRCLEFWGTGREEVVEVRIGFWPFDPKTVFVISALILEGDSSSEESMRYFPSSSESSGGRSTSPFPASIDFMTEDSDDPGSFSLFDRLFFRLHDVEFGAPPTLPESRTLLTLLGRVFVAASVGIAGCASLFGRWSDCRRLWG